MSSLLRVIAALVGMILKSVEEIHLTPYLGGIELEALESPLYRCRLDDLANEAVA